MVINKQNKVTLRACSNARLLLCKTIDKLHKNVNTNVVNLPSYMKFSQSFFSLIKVVDITLAL